MLLIHVLNCLEVRQTSIGINGSVNVELSSQLVGGIGFF